MPDAYRLRAQVFFVPGTGLAAWAVAQNSVRLGQAYDLNAGQADEERSHQSATGDLYVCDLIFPGQALAQDTWNTLIAVCVPGYVSPPSGRNVSWMDMHLCQHEGTPTPCPAPISAWSNRP